MKRDVKIREADAAKDRDLVIGVLARNLPNAAVRARYDWLYLSNPAGESLVWLAEDSRTGEPVGTSAAHPRSMWYHGERVRALILSDFAVDPTHRTLGPALKLLRATLAPVRQGDFAFSYDHPSESMLAIYTRMGARIIAPTRRFVRTIRSGPLLERRLGRGLHTQLAASAGDLLLRFRNRPRGQSGVSVEPCRGFCGSEFDRKDLEVARFAAVVGCRGASFLDWRYQAHATSPHRILRATREGDLIGWAVLRESSSDLLSLVDLYTSGDSEAETALLGSILGIATELRVAAIGAEALDGSPAAEALARMGFAARETGTGVVVYAGPGAEQPETLQQAGEWWMLEGDRDA